MTLKAAFAALAPLLLLPGIPGSVDPDGTNRTGTTTAEITIEGASAAWTQRLEWGLARFESAGLRLPPLVVTVHHGEAKEGCNGNSGLFRPGAPARVDLCVASDADSGVARLTTLHELAHAWAETQLGESQQDAFVAARGLDVWADRAVPRHEWGAEHAAEVVSWGLMDEATPIIRIHDAEPAQLLVAFEALVGRPPRWMP